MHGQDDHHPSLKEILVRGHYLYFLAFALLLVFSIHNFDSIGQDIGRHLKIGEIIWQTKKVPTTNLFSFTEPNFPFTNHHWLSEVIFYKWFSWTGFTGLIWLKITLILATFGILFKIFSPRSDRISFWPILISFLLSIFIFISRTEVRPEIFSFVILALFLFVLFRAKYSPRTDLKNPQGPALGKAWLWLLPFLELLWANLHIYFFVGPFLLLAFFVDRLLGNGVSSLRNPVSKLNVRKVFLIFLLTCLATLFNPNWIHGALAPFNILKAYGYSIVENQTLSFLAAFFSFNLSIFVFKFSVGILITSFILNWRKTRERIFEIIISAFFIYAGFRMLRNLPLYALASFPILALNLTDLTSYPHARLDLAGKLSLVFKGITAGWLIFMIFFVASNSFYNQVGLSRVFGFSVPNGLERAVQFVKENKIKGPMFNNFDIGGYLIWKLYPEEKVFVDNRPEAYSVKFFSEIYKPMQEDKVKWAEFSEKYKINLIFFAHTDATPWGQVFLKNIVKDPAWKIVYLNENAMVLVKNNAANAGIISSLAISEDKAIDRVVKDLQSSNENKADLSLTMSRFFYNINWRQSSLYFSEEAIKADPQNRQAYLNKGLVYAYYTDENNQRLAAENIKRAIDLGLKDSQYYTILGIVYMNLGSLLEAEPMFKKALELDQNNAQAKAFLDKFFHE